MEETAQQNSSLAEDIDNFIENNQETFQKINQFNEEYLRGDIERCIFIGIILTGAAIGTGIAVISSSPGWIGAIVGSTVSSAVFGTYKLVLDSETSKNYLRSKK
jgi:hypothetical protein